MINYDYDSIRYETENHAQKLFIFLKSLAYFLFCYIMACVVIDLYAFIGRSFIMLALVVGIIASLISHWLVPSDRPTQIKVLKQNFLLYVLVMFGAFFLIRILSGLNANEMGVSMGLSTGQVQNNAALGWIQMVLQFIMVGTPISHAVNEVRRIFTFYGFGFGKVTKRKRMEQLQKTIVRK